MLLGLARFKLALCAIEERYRSLLGSMDVGFCVVEMQFDDADNPLDFRFLETNPAFEKQSGLRAMQ
jgi:PAS domain-containing protein